MERGVPNEFTTLMLTETSRSAIHFQTRIGSLETSLQRKCSQDRSQNLKYGSKNKIRAQKKRT